MPSCRGWRLRSADREHQQPGMAIGAAVLGVLTAFLTQGIHKLADVSRTRAWAWSSRPCLRRRDPHHPGGCGWTSIRGGAVRPDRVRAARHRSLVRAGSAGGRQTLLPAAARYGRVRRAVLERVEDRMFDPALAAVMGFRVAVVHYLLMAMVAGLWWPVLRRSARSW